MSIKAYTSIAESYNINNYFDISDDNYNKIRFSIKDQILYITSYDTATGNWLPSTVVFDNVGSLQTQTTSLIDYQDLIFANNVRIQLDAELPANGSEILMFQKVNNYNYIKRTGLNYAIQDSAYLPTTNNDNRLVIYELDSNGKPRLTLSSVSTNDFASTFLTMANDQTITSKKTFNAGKLLLGGNGGNVTLNGSQTASSSTYTLEWPTAAPTGTLNVLTTSGSSPYSKYTWTSLSDYVLSSAFDQLSALSTTGSPSFANMTITSGGALNLNYMSAPASSDVLATINTNKQLTNSGTALSSLCTIGTAQTLTADKTFNYSSGKIKLSNYSTDNTTTNNLLIVNSSGYIVPCNKLYSDINSFSAATSYTFSAAQTFNSNTLLLNGGGAANVTLNAPSISSAYTWTLPSTNPTSGTTNVLMTSSTSSPYTLAWTDLASTYLTSATAASTYLTQTNAGTTYMKLSATQTNSGVNTWSGNNTFNQDKLLLPTLTSTASGTYVLTKNASTGAVEYAASVAWNNINLINSAQTITAVKTYDYTTAKIALTNTTNDTTTTNKVLVLNASNQIVPCDKTYANIGSGGGGGGSTVGTLSASTSNDTLVAINSSGTLTNSAVAYSSLSELNNTPVIPVYQFKFEQNLNSAGSTSYGGASSGTFTYNSSGKYGYCIQSTDGRLTSPFTAINSAAGNSITVSSWIKINATSNRLRLSLSNTTSAGAGLGTLYFGMYDDYVTTESGYKNAFWLGHVPNSTPAYHMFGLNTPDFTQSSSINKWWFFAFSWNSATLTLSIYISDGGGTNNYSTSKTYTSADVSFTNSLSALMRGINNIWLNYTTSGTFLDDFRMYDTALSNTTLESIAQSATDVVSTITPSLLFNTTSQTIYSNKTIDCSQGSLALTNTTNDTTSTNKILTLNTSTNKVTPCDKTYADVFKPQTVDIYDSGGVSYARLLITGGALSVQYYINGTISGSPYALTIPVILPAPVLAWNFNTNLSSSYSTSGTYTFTGGSGSITSGGKFGSCWQNPASASISTTPEMTPFTRASGYSFTFSCWFKYNASSGGGLIRLNIVNNNQARAWIILNDTQLIYLDNNADANAQSLFPRSTYNFPSFSSGTNYEAWTYFAFSWEDSTSTVSFVMYVNGTKYSGSQVISNSNAINYMRLCTRYNASVGAPTINTSGCTNNIRFDDFRIWSRALSDAEMVMIYNATTDA